MAAAFRWKTHLFVSIAIIALAALPALAVAIAALAADTFGCQLDEGDPHRCLAWGTDIGPTLYLLGVSGWLALITLPAGAGALLLYIVAVLVRAFLQARV